MSIELPDGGRFLDQQLPVLVVDDDALVRELQSAVLASLGFRTRQAADAAQAQAHLERERFACVITDLVMPEEGGLAVLRLCKSRFPDVRVIVCSGLAKPPDPRPEGAAHFLPKPFTREQMAMALRSVGAHLSSSG
jgi:DNA-binding NtrC family response regulator